MYSYFATPLGQYYEGNRQHPLDLEVPQRPTPDHRWENGAWVVDAPDVLLDRKAAAVIDGMDRLQFEHLFALENDLRSVHAWINTKTPGTYANADAVQITRAQYRNALINRWKALQ